MEIISKIIGLVGILTFLFAMKQKVDDVLKAMNAPPLLNFYFLFFWATCAALLGGLIWAGCQQLFPALGSTSCDGPATQTAPTLGGSREPHGAAAILWPIATNVPIAALLVILAWHYGFTPPRGAGIGSLIMLAALAIASLTFYDLPLQGQRGMRCQMETMHLGYLKTEFYLVLIWSTLLAVAPFVAMYAANRYGLVSGPAASLRGCGIAIGLIVGLTVTSVGFFIAGYPQGVFESARGVVAGVALRVSLFFGFIVSTKM